MKERDERKRWNKEIEERDGMPQCPDKDLVHRVKNCKFENSCYMSNSQQELWIHLVLNL